MLKTLISLKTTADALEFVNIVSEFSYAANLSFGENEINAKSILRVLGLALGQTAELCIYDDEADDLLDKVACFRCN